MANEIGKIEKPAAEKFVGGRNILLVPLLFAGKESPEDFLKLFDKYWEEAKAQIDSLEMKLGQIWQVYHENIFSEGEDAIGFLEKLNPKREEDLKALIDYLAGDI